MPDGLNEIQQFQLDILLRIHQRMGREDVTPPSATGLEEKTLKHYLNMAYQSVEEMIVSSDLQFRPSELFQTALLMGIAVGVNLERERRAS